MQEKLKKNSLVIPFCFFVLFCLFALIGCKQKRISNNEITEKKEKQLTIGFSIDTLAIERWLRDCDVFLNRAKELGAHVIVQNAGNDTEEQIKQIKYLIDKNVDALVILAKKADSLTEVIQKAKGKNIPIIAYDRLILNANIDVYLTINSRKVGECMAKTILANQPNGEYFCIYGPTDDYNMNFINEGVHSVLAGKPVSITETYYTSGWNYDLSYGWMSEMLAKNRIPDAIICGNDAIAGSVIRALSEYQLAKKIPVSGQDADIAACQYIVEDKQTMTVYKPITELAKLTAEVAYRLAGDEKLQDITAGLEMVDVIENGSGKIPVVWLDPVTVTKENIDDVVIKSGFHTTGEVYRNRALKNK